MTRHGRTPLNAQGIVQGPYLDPSLDDLGREQARRLALRLGDGRPSVLASPLARAVQTAEPTVETRDLDLYEDARLVEIDWGDWNGRPKDASLVEDLRRLSARWARGEASARPPGGESAGEVLRRASAAVEEAWSATPDGSDLLVVAHGRLNKVLLSWLVHGDLRHQEDFPTSNAGLTVLTPTGRRWGVRLLDCRAHLATLASPAPASLVAADA